MTKRDRIIQKIIKNQEIIRTKGYCNENQIDNDFSKDFIEKVKQSFIAIDKKYDKLKMVEIWI